MSNGSVMKDPPRCLPASAPRGSWFPRPDMDQERVRDVLHENLAVPARARSHAEVRVDACWADREAGRSHRRGPAVAVARGGAPIERDSCTALGRQIRVARAHDLELEVGTLRREIPGVQVEV